MADEGKIFFCAMPWHILIAYDIGSIRLAFLIRHVWPDNVV